MMQSAKMHDRDCVEKKRAMLHLLISLIRKKLANFMNKKHIVDAKHGVLKLRISNIKENVATRRQTCLRFDEYIRTL